MLQETILGEVPLQAERRRGDDRSEISIVELSAVLLQRKRFIGASVVATGAVAAAIALLLPVSFRAEATILPPQQQQSSLSALAGSLSGLAGASMASQLGLKNPGDLYVGMLGSRTIADDLVSRFHLQSVYRAKLLSEARSALGKHASFASGKDSLIKIAVEDRDPKRAADLANAFVDELFQQNSRLALTDSSQRRLFFEQQLEKEKDALANAEIGLKNTQQSTGLLAPSGQAEVLIRSGAQLRAEIASREVQLQALQTYATDENPQVEMLKREISALRGQTAQLEANGAPNSKMELSAGKLPEASLEYIRKLRDMKYHETLYELLAKQYEAARIDEAKQAPVIQVIDRAVVPDKKAGPPRALIALGGCILGFVLACAWTILKGALQTISEDSGYSSQLASLNKALRS